MTRVFAALVAELLMVAVLAAPSDSRAGQGHPNGPIVITQGGVYTGNWSSTTAAPAVRISTTAPVAIVDSVVTNTSGGPLIVTDWPLEASVTLRRVRAFGGSGRFFEAEGFKSIRIVNCTIVRTAGIRLASSVAGASVIVRKNRQRNIHGPSQGAARLSYFLQLAEVQTAMIDVSWNEVVSEFGRSEMEDAISVFKTSHARIHNNYIQGGYPLTNTRLSSANGITVEVGDGAPPASHDNAIWNNTVVDSVGGIGLVGGRDNVAHHNRVVQDGRLDDGSRLLAANLGLTVRNLGGFAGFTNNRAHGNVVGYVHGDGFRNDYWLPDAPDDISRNVSLRGRVTRATERREWLLWTRKLSAGRIRVGA
jgi:hypothetical protein